MPAAPATVSAARLLRWLAAAAIGVYGLGFLLHYSATPLGLSPVLDGREMLALARQIATASLPAEAFYRAPLYPALLALVAVPGISDTDLAFIARLLNFSIHCAAAALVWLIAERLWRSTMAALLATLLYGLNPVVLHFVADPLDITLAMGLMLAGIWATLRAEEATGAAVSRRGIAFAGLCFAAAVLARPQMLTVLVAWLLFLALTPAWRPRLATALASTALVLGVMGAANHALSGDFRVLPWQGAFNLWAANGSAANGRYFAQTTRLAVYDPGINPARLESERLYRAARPHARGDIASMNRYWRERTIAEIGAAPMRWLQLLGVKAWYLLNNFEQYNNKTYFVHKALSPWLRMNPLGWSIVLALAVLGSAALRGPAVRLLALAVLAYGTGLLLTYVSARFRLPLVPIGAILAGGVVVLPRRRGTWLVVALAVVVFVVSRTPLPAAERERTVPQDHLLLARAANESGDYAVALQYADRVAAALPAHAGALELACAATFNRWLRSAQRTDELAQSQVRCARSADSSAASARVLGIILWRRGEEAQALAIWDRLARAAGPEQARAEAALVMTGARSRAAAPRSTTGWAALDDVVLLAWAARGHEDALAQLAQRLPAARRERELRELLRTFRRAGAASLP